MGGAVRTTMADFARHRGAAAAPVPLCCAFQIQLYPFCGRAYILSARIPALLVPGKDGVAALWARRSQTPIYACCTLSRADFWRDDSAAEGGSRLHSCWAQTWHFALRTRLHLPPSMASFAFLLVPSMSRAHFLDSHIITTTTYRFYYMPAALARCVPV